MTMAEFRFYGVARGRTSRVLRAMLEKTLSRGDRAVVRVSSVRREEELDIFLWMDPASGFLPHGRWEEGRRRGGGEDFTAQHPVLLTTGTRGLGTDGEKGEAINGANVLFHWQEGEDAEEGINLARDGGIFGLCCFLYEEGDGGAGGIAEKLWGELCGMEDVKAGFWYEEGGGWRRREEKDKVAPKREEAIREQEQVHEQAQEQAQGQAHGQAEDRQEEEVREKEVREEEKEEEPVMVNDPSQESLF